MRRALIILALVIVLAGVGVAAYFYIIERPSDVAVIPPSDVSLPTAPSSTTTPSGGGETPAQPVAVTARLVKISDGPVVPGAAVVDRGAASASTSAEVAVSFVERQSGNVFSYLLSAKSLTRTSNKTIPGIQSAAWFPNASSTVVRYLSGDRHETVNTFVLPADGSAAGFFLPQNLSDIAVSSMNMLMLATGVNGSVATVAKTDGSRPAQVFSTPLTSLRVSFAGKNQYFAYTKPAASLQGDAYLIDSAGRFSRVAGPLPGLAALVSPSGKYALVSYTAGGQMQLSLITLATSETLSLPVSTIADKCVWAADDSAAYCGVPISPPGAYAYPDDWYQGAVSFSDRIWKIDVVGRLAQLTLDFPVSTDKALDAIGLAIDPAKIVLVFTNKRDGSLWAYSL